MLEKNNNGAKDFIEKENDEAVIKENDEITKKEKEDKLLQIANLKIVIYDNMAKIERHTSKINNFIKEQLENNVDHLKMQILENDIKEITQKMIALSE